MPKPTINERSDGYYDAFRSRSDVRGTSSDAAGFGGVKTQLKSPSDPIVEWLAKQPETPEPFDFWPESRLESST